MNNKFCHFAVTGIEYEKDTSSNTVNLFITQIKQYQLNNLVDKNILADFVLYGGDSK